MKINVKAEGVTEAAAAITETGVRAGDVRPTEPELTHMFEAEQERRFAAQGPGWPKLAEATVEAKARLGQPAAILRATNALYDSLTRAAGEVSSTEQLAFGTNIDYARFHQYGTRFMPKRRPVDLSQAMREQMTDVLAAYIGTGAT